MAAIHTPTLKTPEAAALLGIHPQMLRRLRLAGRGPVFFLIGRYSYRYREADLAQWIETRKVIPAIEEAPIGSR